MRHTPDHRASQLAGWIISLGIAAAALFFISLTTHQSREAAVWNRYSWPYAAVVAMAGLALAAAGLAALRWRARLPGAIVAGLSRLPADAVFAGLLIAGGLVGWLYHYPPYGIFASAWFHGGSLLLLILGALCLATRFLVRRLEPAALASLWALLFGALAAILAARLGVDLHGVRLAALAGPLAGYAMFRAVSALAARPSLWTGRLSAGPRHIIRWAAIGAALALFILAVYGPARQHGLLNNDEIQFVNHIVAQGGLAGVLRPASTVLFRPLFQLQAWLDYSLFGLNHAGYVLVQLGLVWLSAVAVFALLARLTGRLLVSGLLAAVVIAHRFVADLVSVWAIDTLTLNALLAVLVILFQAYRPASRYYYAALALLLFIGCLSRENGLVTVGAVGFSALLRLRRPAAERSRAAREFVVTLLVLAAYVLLRRWWLGNDVPPRLFIQETCLGLKLLQREELAALPMRQQAATIAYTVAANLIAPVAPFLFGGTGCLTAANWGAWLPPLLGVVGGVWLGHVAERPRVAPGPLPTQRNAWGLLLLSGIVAGGPLLLWAAPSLASLGRSDHLDLWLHGVVTLLLLLSLARQWPASPAPWLALVNVIGVWLLGALVFGLYFRYRNFYLLLFGWAIVAALGWPGRQPAGGRGRSLSASLSLLTMALLIASVARVRGSLPVPWLLAENFTAPSVVCWPGISDGFAVEWSREYRLEAEVSACRAQARCDPTTWQLPFTEGQTPWSPSPADNCAVVEP